MIIHVVKTLPRLVGGALRERLRVMPAVVVTGARQTGKSTLAEHLVGGGRRHQSLDELDVLDAARRDPDVLVGGNEPVTHKGFWWQPLPTFEADTGRRILLGNLLIQLKKSWLPLHPNRGAARGRRTRAVDSRCG